MAIELPSEFRHAIRVLVREPAFAAAVVLTLAIGVGATTAVFALVDTLFFRSPAGLTEPGALTRLYIVRDDGMLRTPSGGGGSYPDFQSIRTGTRDVAEVAAFLNPSTLSIGSGDHARQSRGQAVSGGFFTVLGTRMAMGRAFLPEEDGATGAHPVAVVSDRFWRTALAADSAALGSPMLLNGRSLTIIGVAEPGFTGIGLERLDIWVPLAMAASIGIMSDDGADWRELPVSAALRFVARLAPASDAATAQDLAGAALARSSIADLDPTPRVIAATPLSAASPRRSRTADLALWLLAMSGLILTMVGANLANLFLVRSTRRRREMASRLALGAGPGRLLRLVLSESLALTALGLAAGLMVAMLLLSVMSRFPLPQATGELSLRILLFATLVAALAGSVPAIVSAIGIGRADPGRALGGTRAPIPPGRGRVRSALVALQVAVSVVLLAGAALFVRSARNAAAVDPGVDVDRLLIVSVPLARNGFDHAARSATNQAVIERLEQLPGIERVSMTHFAPLEGSRYSTEVQVRGQERPLDDHPSVHWIGAGYFETAGTPMIQGRGIAAEDVALSEPVVVINQALARLVSSTADPLGSCLAIPSQLEDGACARVVGIVRDHRRTYLDPEITPAIYLSRAQQQADWASVDGHIVVRTIGNAATVIEAVRGAIRSVRPDLPFATVEPLESRLSQEMLPLRLGFALFIAFGIVAAAVATLGVYAVISYFVAERRSELAIRQSLGATTDDVLRLVLKNSMAPVAAGIVLGLATAWGGGRLIEAQLYEMAGRDALSFAAAAALIAAVSLAATILPARRGARTDPAEALRAD